MRNKIFMLMVGAALAFPILLASCKSNAEQKSISIERKYHCPMHPRYVSDKPGNCPICGMELVPSMPVTPGKQEAVVPVEGQATVDVSADRRQLIGVTVAPVERRDLTSAIRASARVAYDPDLYNAIYEHQQVLATHPSPSLAHASELRLRQMGLSEDQIRDVSKPGFDPSNLLLSEKGGHAWVYIDIYDYEASSVKPGQKADLTASASPGKIYSATIRSIDTVLNSETRTLRARADVVNTDGALRPEMYLDAVIHVPVGRALAAPESAVMDTGTRQLVYVEKSPGEYEPRPVILGKKAEGFYEIVSGLKEGERVVTSANFLIDSESKLKAAAQEK